MIYLASFFVIALFLTSSCGHDLPEYIHTCSRSDPKLNECGLKHAKLASKQFVKGDPERGLEALDPLYIKEVQSVSSTNGPGIKISLKDVYIKGTTNMEPKKMNIDVKKRKVSVFLTDDYLEVDGKYDVNGRILLLPIRGNGKAKINLSKIKALYSFDFDLKTKKNGKEYVKITSDDMKVDIGNAHLQLDNLFNGDKVLGETTNRVLNEAWQEVIAELLPPIVKDLKTHITKQIKKLLTLATYDEFLTP